MLLFSFPIFQVENENNSMKKKMQNFDHRNLIYGIIGSKKPVLVRQGKRAIRVRAIEVLLNMGTYTFGMIIYLTKLRPTVRS